MGHPVHDFGDAVLFYLFTELFYATYTFLFMEPICLELKNSRID